MRLRDTHERDRQVGRNSLTGRILGFLSNIQEESRTVLSPPSLYRARLFIHASGHHVPHDFDPIAYVYAICSLLYCWAAFSPHFQFRVRRKWVHINCTYHDHVNAECISNWSVLLVATLTEILTWRPSEMTWIYSYNKNRVRFDGQHTRAILWRTYVSVLEYKPWRQKRPELRNSHGYERLRIIEILSILLSIWLVVYFKDRCLVT